MNEQIYFRDYTLWRCEDIRLGVKFDQQFRQSSVVGKCEFIGMAVPFVQLVVAEQVDELFELLLSVCPHVLKINKN